MEYISEANLAELLTLRKVVMPNGTIFYHNERGQVHRLYGPAIIYPTGSKLWCYEDEYHRDNAPAVMYADGGCEWYQHGVRHRIGGPAIEYKEGVKEYWENGNYIRSERG